MAINHACLWTKRRLKKGINLEKNSIKFQKIFSGGIFVFKIMKWQGIHKIETWNRIKKWSGSRIVKSWNVGISCIHIWFMDLKNRILIRHIFASILFTLAIFRGLNFNLFLNFYYSHEIQFVNFKLKIGRLYAQFLASNYFSLEKLTSVKTSFCEWYDKTD